MIIQFFLQQDSKEGKSAPKDKVDKMEKPESSEK